MLTGVAGVATQDGYLVTLAPPLQAALRVPGLPSAVDAELFEDGERQGRVASAGEYENKILTLLELGDLLPAAPTSPSFGD